MSDHEERLAKMKQIQDEILELERSRAHHESLAHEEQYIALKLKERIEATRRLLSQGTGLAF